MREEIKKLIDNNIHDFFMNLFYYDRKENADYKPGVLEDYIRHGIVSVDEIVEEFRRQLENSVKVK